MGYKEDFYEWISSNSKYLNSGSSLMIVKGPIPSDWYNSWNSRMNKHIGKIFKFSLGDIITGIAGGINYGGYVFPFTCIKIIPNKIPDNIKIL